MIELDGRKVRLRKPKHAVEAGIALLPKDRKTQGLFLPLPIDFNIAAGNYRLLAPLKTIVLRSRERRAARPLMKSLAVKAPGPGTKAGALSGGNQQKVLLARLLVGRPKVVILDEPTRGVDVDAKEEIHRLIFDLAANGAAVAVISSELPEALKLADRLIVVRSGHIHGVYARGEASSAAILGAAIGDEPSGNGGNGHGGA
jgi:rhamnose transport system ATP-binding protein